jgi:hypothetical protein
MIKIYLEAKKIKTRIKGIFLFHKGIFHYYNVSLRKFWYLIKYKKLKSTVKRSKYP